MTNDVIIHVPTHDGHRQHDEKYTKSWKRLMSNINKSALIDHAVTENHIIDREGMKIY